MTYNIDICGLKRDLPICKLNDELAIGAFCKGLYLDAEFLSLPREPLRQQNGAADSR